MLFRAAGKWRLRSKKTQLSQSTYAYIKVLTQSTKAAGQTVLRYEKYLHFFFFLWCNAAKSFCAFNHRMVFSPEAEVGGDSTSSQIPCYLPCFGESHHVIGRRQISSHSIVACRGREGGGNTSSWLCAQFLCASDGGTLSAVVRGICCVMMIFDIMLRETLRVFWFCA